MPLNSWFGLYCYCGVGFTLQVNYTQCWIDLMRCVYEPQSNTYHSLPGVEIAPPPPGGTEVLMNVSSQYLLLRETGGNRGGGEEGITLMNVMDDLHAAAGVLFVRARHVSEELGV
jgi:hypothetical protein